ncbi:phage tail tape measure protein, partial [Campylobacter taeniopygiae]
VAFLTNPIGLALMAIAAIAALVIMNWDKVKAFFINFIGKISSAFSAFGDFFKGVWQGIGEFFSSLWDSLFGWFSSKFEWLSNAFSKIKDIAKSVASFFGFNEKENTISNESNEIKQNEVRNSLTSKKSIETKTSNAVNVNVNGTFNISSNNGVFDLKAFAKEVEMSVLNALNKNADKTKQTTIWG